MKSGQYEGGSVLWECSLDLINFIAINDIKGEHVLDLGCGQGTVGIYVARQGTRKSLHFTDYNASVIERSLMDSLALNKLDCVTVSASSADWSKFGCDATKFDLILTSETIYNTDYYDALHGVFERSLTENGRILLAAKDHYFGCGGSVIGFVQFCQRRNMFSIRTVWETDDRHTGIKVMNW